MLHFLSRGILSKDMILPLADASDRNQKSGGINSVLLTPGVWPSISAKKKYGVDLPDVMYNFCRCYLYSKCEASANRNEIWICGSEEETVRVCAV